MSERYEAVEDDSPGPDVGFPSKVSEPTSDHVPTLDFDVTDDYDDVTEAAAALLAQETPEETQT